MRCKVLENVHRSNRGGGAKGVGCGGGKETEEKEWRRGRVNARSIDAARKS